MFMTIIAVAGALAQAQAATPVTPAAPAAAPAGRTLKDLPSTTVTYYDIPGKNGPAIEKSLKKVLADPAKKDATRLFTYDVGAQIMKSTTGQKCTVTSAKSTLSANVHLPRLAEEAKVPKEVVTMWRTYVAGVEADAAANLWFIKDHLPAVEQSMAGLSCDQANPTWNASLDKMKAQLSEFAAQRAAAAKAAQKPAAKSGEKSSGENAKLPESY